MVCTKGVVTHARNELYMVSGNEVKRGVAVITRVPWSSRLIVNMVENQIVFGDVKRVCRCYRDLVLKLFPD